VAAECSWGTHPEGIRFDNRFLGEQGTGGDDGAGSDDGAVENDRAHADEAAGFDGAAVEYRVVAHGDIVANVNAILFFHAVEGAVVLNVGVVADANLVNIAAEDSVHPDAGMFAENDVADELGGVVDVAGVGELGSDAFVGADHALSDAGSAMSDHCLQDAMVRGKYVEPLSEFFCSSHASSRFYLGTLRRALEDETQPRSALFPCARDFRIVFVHSAVINTQIGIALEVQSRLPVGDGGD